MKHRSRTGNTVVTTILVAMVILGASGSDAAESSCKADVDSEFRKENEGSDHRIYVWKADVTTEEGFSGRLFNAELAQLRSTYTFNAKSWLRLIGQWRRTERRPELYDIPEDHDELSERFDGSLVFAYKLNWQTVLYVGYGDSRELDELQDNLEPSSREAFLKISYAFQG